MKAMSTTLVIVVTAIVILVAALVLITIFSQGVAQFSTLTQAGSYCITVAQSSCSTTDTMPTNWNIPSVRIGDGPTISCASALSQLGYSPCECDPTTHTLSGCV